MPFQNCVILYVLKAKNIFVSVVATTKTGIPVKIVIIRNRNKKSECLYLLSTDGDCAMLKLYAFTGTVSRSNAFLSTEIFIKAWNRIPKQKL